MSTSNHDVFRPVEGALMDLESLQAISASIEAQQGAWLSAMWPGVNGLVLEGLEPHGEWSPDGPPGTLRPNARAEGVTVSPGRAIVTDSTGRMTVLTIREELFAQWPGRSGASIEGSLVLVPRVDAADPDGKVVVARERVSALIGFVRPGQEQQPFLLPLAQAVGNGRDWLTDLQRLWQPDHPAIQILLKKFETLEQTVWNAEPEGSVWDRQVLGRNWVRYQTVAASAIQSTRMILHSRPTNTRERVLLMQGLYEQLNSSVERAGNELLQLLGPAEGAGPYKAVGPQTEE